MTVLVAIWAPGLQAILGIVGATGGTCVILIPAANFIKMLSRMRTKTGFADSDKFRKMELAAWFMVLLCVTS